MKKSIFLGSLAALAVCVACQNPKPADTVHLKGQLNVGANPVAMKYNGAASMLGDSRDILIRHFSPRTRLLRYQPEYIVSHPG